jgi:diacylglycerol O-acyltransferase/trehalose O-mycolyltransferase
VQKRHTRNALIAAAAVVGLALAGGPAIAAGGRPGAATSKCQDGLSTVEVRPSPGVTVTDDHVNILLPAGYCAGSAAGLRYPVLYLLHGAGDTYKAWVTNTDLVIFARSLPDAPIIVMPDGGHGAQSGWYSNWLDDQYQWETFHTHDLPDYVNSHYRTIAHDVGIAGLSMGGFGALSYAGRHQGMFKVAASFSGALDMLYGAPATGVVFTELNSQYGTPDDRVWGNQLTNYQTWAAHNPTSLAAKLKGTAVLLASGTGTPGGAQGDDPSNPGGYALENGIFQMNLQMVRALELAGVPFQQDFYPGGYHGWPYWQADMHWALPIIDGILGGPRAN